MIWWAQDAVSASEMIRTHGSWPLRVPRRIAAVMLPLVSSSRPDVGIEQAILGLEYRGQELGILELCRDADIHDVRESISKQLTQYDVIDGCASLRGDVIRQMVNRYVIEIEWLNQGDYSSAQE